MHPPSRKLDRQHLLRTPAAPRRELSVPTATAQKPAAAAAARNDLLGLGGLGGLEDLGKQLLDLAGKLAKNDPVLGRGVEELERLLGWGSVPISSHDDDPFVNGSTLEKLSRKEFTLDRWGRPVGLEGPKVKIQDEPVIFREDPATGNFIPFATNPWPEPKPNAQGTFSFPNETRFPKHEIVRGPDGRPLPNPDGLQQWIPRDLHLGMTTAFEAAVTSRNSMESWAGRPLKWGEDGQLQINSHSFVDFNAFYSPTSKGLFFGVVPYRLPGSTEVKMFEMATSWEVAAHEAGHALHDTLKPNRNITDLGYRTWGESFGDQTEMWASLRDPDRARALLKEVNGSLSQSNSLTRIGEVLASLIGEGTGIRDAFHDKTVSTTTPEVHDRSEVLTGAAYSIFTGIFNDLKGKGCCELDALQRAGDMMGTFLARAADHVPENAMTLEDVAKAYLKVDKEHFGGRYQDALVKEFTRRELFDATSVAEFNAHEAALPALSLRRKTPSAADALIQANLDKLGVGEQFGLKLQEHLVLPDGRQVVRVQLTSGRGPGAEPLENHGILTFRRDGSLEDYHGPIPAGVSPGDAKALLDKARDLGLDKHGAGLQLVMREDGQPSVEALSVVGQGLNSYVKAFSLESPDGERREVVDKHPEEKLRGLLPSGAQILTPEELAGL
jgi:hypothetical protein